ncbi:hypothetical protein B566_EDAN012293 [Ephemera danica]|nr:hypothetical protein B566_EDAN012293 [Ephemera danica]
MTLASVESVEKQICILNFMKIKPSPQPMLTSGFRMDETDFRNVRWCAGPKNDKDFLITRQQWAQGEPNTSSKERCIGLKHNGTVFGLGINQCNQIIRFICEAPCSQQGTVVTEGQVNFCPPPTLPPTTTPPPCVTNDMMNYVDAEMTCCQMGMQLLELSKPQILLKAVTSFYKLMKEQNLSNETNKIVLKDSNDTKGINKTHEQFLNSPNNGTVVQPILNNTDFNGTAAKNETNVPNTLNLEADYWIGARRGEQICSKHFWWCSGGDAMFEWPQNRKVSLDCMTADVRGAKVEFTPELCVNSNFFICQAPKFVVDELSLVEKQYKKCNEYDCPTTMNYVDAEMTCCQMGMQLLELSKPQILLKAITSFYEPNVI